MAAAWITPENLEPYEENLAKHGSKAKNRKDPTFADALRQAQDPVLAEEIIRRSLASATATDNEDEDDDDDVVMNSAESEVETTSRRRTAAKREPRNGRGRKATISNKRTSTGNDSSGDEANTTTTPKRSRTIAARRRSVSPEETPKRSSAKREGSTPQPDTKDTSPRSGTPSRHGSPEHFGYKSGGPSPSKDDAKSERGSKGTTTTTTQQQQGKNHGKPYYFLMQIRHKLQKTVIKCDAPKDLASVDELFRKLEDFDMTLELIQETKLGKVMRIIASSEKIGSAPEEKFDIKGRARRLAEKWRRLITKLREGSAELATPESPVNNDVVRPQAVEASSDSKSGKEAGSNGTVVSEKKSKSVVAATTTTTTTTKPKGSKSEPSSSSPPTASSGIGTNGAAVTAATSAS
ncbi:hypothetical protein EV175_001749 [Coemansia sp. RSA 1933]|nr:hypothetical protein EV175_001749 [Coemansia sp. RSA 1933]